MSSSVKDKGLIKIKNFDKNKNKINYIYSNAEGILEKTFLTINFMKKKLKEYIEVKYEIEKINNKW